MNNFFNWLIDLLSHNKITALEKENAGIMDTNIMLMERVAELTRENKKLTEENQRLKNELMDKNKKPTTWDSVEGYAESLRKNPAPEHFPYVNYFMAELEKSIKARGKNPEDSFVWREMKERSEEAKELETTLGIVDGNITHVSISPEEYSRITRELARHQLCIKQQGQE